MVEIFKKNDNYFLFLSTNDKALKCIKHNNTIIFNKKTKKILLPRNRTFYEDGVKKIEYYELTFNEEIKNDLFLEFPKLLKKILDKEISYERSLIRNSCVYAIIINEELKKIKEKLNEYR